MSPLTPDERAEATGLLRHLAGFYHQQNQAEAYDNIIALADKLEAEPDLMGALADSLKVKSHPYVVQERDKARAERDEAREALRDLSAAIEGLSVSWSTRGIRVSEAEWEAIAVPAAAARAVLEGVERTHALVPLRSLNWIAYALSLSPGQTMSETRRSDLARACEAAVHGERVDWPGAA